MKTIRNLIIGGLALLLSLGGCAKLSEDIEESVQHVTTSSAIKPGHEAIKGVPISVASNAAIHGAYERGYLAVQLDTNNDRRPDVQARYSIAGVGSGIEITSCEAYIEQALERKTPIVIVGEYDNSVPFSDFNIKWVQESYF